MGSEKMGLFFYYFCYYFIDYLSQTGPAHQTFVGWVNDNPELVQNTLMWRVWTVLMTDSESTQTDEGKKV